MFQLKQVRTFFQYQEFKSEFCSKEFYAAMHTRTPFDKALHLGSLLRSDLRTVSDGTQSQQSKSDGCANEFYVAMCFKTLFLRYSAYLRS